MNNNGGAISFDALINNSQFLKSFQEMEERIKGFTNKATAEAEKTDTVFSKLGKAIENTFTSDNLREVAQQIIKVRGEFQALEGSLKVMLGSKEKADELMTQVADLAAKTPLSLTQVGESAKLMVAYGFSTDTVIGHLQMLGDVAHGVNMPIEDLVNTFGAIRTNGVASLSDIEGMAGKGIPIFEVLGNVLNTNRDGVEKMVEASKVGLPQIELAFQSMTSTGGMFSGVMKEQAKSVDALMTNLEESINRVYNEIGKDTDGLVAGTLQMGVSMLENYQSIAKILEVLAIAYGASKASLIIYNVVVGIQTQLQLEAALAGRALSVSEGLAAVGAKGLSMATAELNAVMAVNPYVLMATAIVAVVSAMVLTRKETIELKNANELLAESIKEVKDNHIGEKEEVLANIQVLKDKNVADSVREQAYKRINELSPKLLEGMSLEEAKIKDLTLVTRNYIAELEQKIQLEGNSSALKKGIKQRNDLQEVYDNIDKAYQEKLKRVNQLKKSGTQADKLKLYGDGQDNLGLMYDLEQLKKELDAAKIKLQESKDEIEKLNKNRVSIYANDPAVNALKATIEGEKIRLKGIKNNLSPEYKQLEDSIKKHQKELDSLQNTNKPSNTVVKNKSYWDEELKRRQEEFYKVEKGAKNYEKLKAAVKEAQKELKNYNVNEGPNKTNNVPQVDEKLKGTIAYYDQIIARSKYLQERTTNQSSLTTLIVEQGDAMRKKAELQEANDKQLKELSVKSTREQIEEAESQYKIYENFKTVLGKDSADKQKQFAELIKNGHSFTEYLLKQQEKYKAELSKNPEDEKASENLVVTTVKYNEVTGKKTRLQQLTEDIAKVKVEAKDLSEVLEKLESYQSGLKGDTSESGRDQSEFLQAEIEDVKKKQLKELDDFLASFEDFESQKTQIATKYANLRKTLTDKYKGDTTSEAYKKELSYINEGEDAALELIESKRNENSKSFQRLQDKLNGESLKGLKIALEVEQKKLEAADLSEKKRTQIELRVQQLQENVDNLSKKNIQDFLSFGQNLSSVLSNMGGSASDFGRNLSGLINLAENFKELFTLKKGFSGMELFNAIGGGVLGLVSIIGNVLNAESEYEKKVKEWRKNALQFELDYRIAINKRLGEESAVNESIYGKNYLDRLKDAFKMLYDAQDNLKKSIAQLGQTTITIGQIYNGSKWSDINAKLLKAFPDLIQTAANGYQTINKELAQSLVDNNQLTDTTKQLVQDTIKWQNQLDDASKKIKEVFSDLTGSLGDKLRDGLVNAFKDGTSAAEAFGQAVGGILEDMMSKLIFNAVFSKALKTLEDDLSASFDPKNTSADYNAMDDFGRFMSQYSTLYPQFQKMLQEAKDSAAAAGIKIFQPSNSSSGSSSLTGSVKSITEDTAGLLAGNITQLRVVATSQLVSLRNVEMIASQQLTLQAKFLPFLERIDNNLNKLNSGDNILRVKF